MFFWLFFCLSTGGASGPALFTSYKMAFILYREKEKLKEKESATVN